METRQLAYFVLACQVPDQAEAASLAGITQSTLSETLTALEAETGLQLFRRGPRRRYPTEAARWLCQIAERILQLVEAAETGRRQATSGRIEILSPLHLMLGRLYRASNLAARALRAQHSILATVRFHSPLEPLADGEPPHVILTYNGDQEFDPAMFLFDDDWVAVCPADFPVRSGTIDIDTLRRLPVLIPSMMTVLEEQARRYCWVNGLPEPATVEEDLGSFSRLSRQTQPFVLLAPRTLVTGGLLRSSLQALPLDPPLRSPVVADVSEAGDAGRDYVSILQGILAKPPAPAHYSPALSLRQLRYFLATADAGSISAAARKLNVVQPALSSQLRKLEATLEGPVFDRGTRGIELTALGQSLLGLTREVIGWQEHIVRECRAVSEAERHHITIGIEPPVGPAEAIAEAVSQWLEIYPEAHIRFVERPLSELSPLLENGEVSFILAEDTGKNGPRIPLAPAQKIGLLFVKAPDTVAGASGIGIERLGEIPLIVPPEGNSIRRIIEQAVGSVSVHQRIVAEMTSVAMAVRLLGRIEGAILASRTILEDRATEGLEFIPLMKDLPQTQLSALFSSQRGLRDNERILVRLLQKTLSDGNRDGGSRPNSSPRYRTEVR